MIYKSIDALPDKLKEAIEQEGWYVQVIPENPLEMIQELLSTVENAQMRLFDIKKDLDKLENELNMIEGIAKELESFCYEN